MRFILFAVLLSTALAGAQEDAVTVDATQRAGIICQLQRRNESQPAYMVRLANDSRRGVRIDFRVLSRTTATWIGSAVLFPAGDSSQRHITTISLPAGSDYFGADIMTVTTGSVREIIETRTEADGKKSTVTVLELKEDGPTPAEREAALVQIHKSEQLKAEALRQELAAVRHQQDRMEAAYAQQQQLMAAQAAENLERERLMAWRTWLCLQRHHQLCVAQPQTVTPQPAHELTWEEFRDRELTNERQVWKNP